MAIYKINFVPIKLPPAEKDYIVGQIYTYEAPKDTYECEYEVKFNIPGDYEIDYWAIDTAGNEEQHKKINFTVIECETPAVENQGFRFTKKIDGDSTEAILEKDTIQVFFYKTFEGIGQKFDWSSLDIRGLKLSAKRSDNPQYLDSMIEIEQGCWLARRLNNYRKTITVSVLNGQDVILMLSTPFQLVKDGVLLSNLPRLVQNYIDKVYKENNQLVFTIKRACKLKVIGT